MIRNILIVTVASFFLSVVCLTVAVSMAGPEIISRGAWGLGMHGWSWDWGGNHHAFGWTRSYSDETSTNREQDWVGETLDVDVPADVHFAQSDGAGRLRVSGPKSAVDHLIVHEGHVTIDSRYPMDDGKLVIELSAPKVTHFALNGSGRLDIASYRQDSLELHVNGDGEITAQGAAKSVKLDISGSGKADLGELAMDAAEVNISGSGSAKMGPKTSARLDISGSGDVTLTSHPKHLESHVSGSGTINQEDGDTTEDATPPEKPASKSGKSV